MFLKIMRKLSLAKKAFLKPFEKDLISKIGPAYFVLIGIGQLVNSIQPEISTRTDLVFFLFYFTISLILLFIGPLIFYPILIEGLRANISKSKFVFPKLNLILKKAWKIFIAGIMPTIFVFLGIICFIIPGIFLAKRYIYVPFIVEKEMIGPLEAMRKSRTLSRKNGWTVILANIYCSIPYVIISIPILLLDPTINTNSQTPIIFSTLITIIISWFTTISTSSALFFGYINSEDQS